MCSVCWEDSITNSPIFSFTTVALYERWSQTSQLVATGPWQSHSCRKQKYKLICQACVALRAHFTPAVKFFPFIFPSFNKPYLNLFILFFFLTSVLLLLFPGCRWPSPPAPPATKTTLPPAPPHPPPPSLPEQPGPGEPGLCEHPRLSSPAPPPAPAAPGSGPPRPARRRPRVPGRARWLPGLRPSPPVNSPRAAAAAGPSADTGPSPAGTAQPPARPPALARPLGSLRGTEDLPGPPGALSGRARPPPAPAGGEWGSPDLPVITFYAILDPLVNVPTKHCGKALPRPPAARRPARGGRGRDGDRPGTRAGTARGPAARSAALGGPQLFPHAAAGGGAAALATGNPGFLRCFLVWGVFFPLFSFFSLFLAPSPFLPRPRALPERCGSSSVRRYELRARGGKGRSPPVLEKLGFSSRFFSCCGLVGFFVRFSFSVVYVFWAF